MIVLFKGQWEKYKLTISYSYSRLSIFSRLRMAIQRKWKRHFHENHLHFKIIQLYFKSSQKNYQFNFFSFGLWWYCAESLLLQSILLSCKNFYEWACSSHICIFFIWFITFMWFISAYLSYDSSDSKILSLECSQPSRWCNLAPTCPGSKKISFFRSSLTIRLCSNSRKPDL